MEIDNNICALRQKMEEVLGQKVATPQDFDLLVNSIAKRTHQLISVSTLKRFYGYVTFAGTLRTTTLDVLCQYVGYMSWESFCTRETAAEQVESYPLLADSMPTTCMSVGDKVIVAWKPDRECVFAYMGDNRFVVEQSRGSKLCVGDTFVCHHFVQGEPLCLLDCVMQGRPPVTYLCGRDHGVIYTRIVND